MFVSYRIQRLHLLLIAAIVIGMALPASHAEALAPAIDETWSLVSPVQHVTEVSSAADTALSSATEAMPPPAADQELLNPVAEASFATQRAALGVATYYGTDFHGRPMANGQVYNMYDPTVTASNSFPLGTRLQVQRADGGPWDHTLTAAEAGYYYGHSIFVTVTDRGAFTHLLDLSYGAFSMLGRPDEGVIAVQVFALN